MQSLVLELDQSPPVKEDPKKISHSNDLLGGMLQGKYIQWADARRLNEKAWLEDLRAFNQQNEPDEEKLSKFHAHIYIGLTRTKVCGAYNRITDLLFQSKKHWGIVATPVPESDKGDPGVQDFLDEMQRRAAAMETEIADQLLDLKYEDHLKSAILEGCIIGTGVVKGIIPGTRKIEKWGFTANPETGVAEWDMITAEIPYPVMSAPSIFDVITDPYANDVDDMSGVFERHVVNRAQFSELKDDPHFDAEKINEILAQSETGNHVSLYHETERRQIANVIDTTGNNASRFDVLEYWGQVTGRMLKASGVDEVEDNETYWANVWVCSGKTLLARVVPMKRQRIPYNFFLYSKVPHQFFGVGPGRMMRNSQRMLNGSTRLLLDGMAMAAIPMQEVNVSMLQDDQDPNIMQPGQTWLRDSGDPSVPCVRFFQPNIPTGALMQMSEMCKQLASEESNIPAYSYGDMSSETNKTSSGLGMQLNVASIPIKSVVKNLESQVIKNVIGSLYDWNMTWNDNEQIKGDHEIEVLGSSQLVAKEQHVQALMQFANITQNSLDLNFVDRKYLLSQIANGLEIDIKKVFPDKLPPQQTPPPPPPDPIAIAKANLLDVQAKKEIELTKKTIAETANTNINSQFSSAQAAQVLLTNPATVPTADSLLLSAGYVDSNGLPMATVPNQGQISPQQLPGVGQNNHPNFPANPATPESGSNGVPMNNLPKEPTKPDLGVASGIETMRPEPLANAG